MLLTNALGLPATLVQIGREKQAVTPREYSISSLFKGVRQVILERRYHQEITRDVAEMLWSWLGRTMGACLSSHYQAQGFQEQKVRIPLGDCVLTGRLDGYHQEDKAILQYKLASVWKMVYGDWEEWRCQLLVYGYVLGKMGLPVERGDILVLFKDHSKREARGREDYPPLPGQVLSFAFGPEDFAACETWLFAKLAAIKGAEGLGDQDLPRCTPGERYHAEDKYAVMKQGRKKALRLLDSRAEAEAWMAAKGGDAIVFRPGEDRKCLYYCPVAKFCQYRVQDEDTTG